MAAPVARSESHSRAINRLISDLDIQGYTSIEIAEILAEQYNIRLSPRAIQLRLRKLNAAVSHDREEYIRREERLLNWVIHELMMHWEQTPPERRQSKTLAAIVQASESRRRLLGLDAPFRQEHSGVNGEPIRIIEITSV